MTCKKRHGRGAIPTRNAGTLESELSQVVQGTYQSSLSQFGTPSQKPMIKKRLPVRKILENRKAS